MQRVTVTLDEDLIAELDRFIESRGYQNRSEAVRDLARSGLRQAAEAAGEGEDAVGALVYLYDHEARNMSKRLTEAHHRHHDLSVCTLHMHLDDAQCLEVALLRGPTRSLRHFSEHLIAERGVRHGRLVLVPVEARAGGPAADPGGHGHGHGPGHHHHHDED
ncbi:nickel-responsive transcriptional regulator NikR [Xanthobacter sp. KR7-225]|uniref:nickel-responsive transcriptional regulator NikR n=1 Tax=Xanthobacter sp. KR7-225 TaxID=3156613 RepID=UPI0032B5798D